MDENSDFQKRMVEYLESVHIGEFFTGNQQSVQKDMNLSMIDDDYKDPTQTMPDSPPLACRRRHKCVGCA